MSDAADDPGYATYEECRAQWEEFNREIGRIDESSPRLTRSTDFRRDLLNIWSETNDDIFLQAYEHLLAHECIREDGSWNPSFKSRSEIENEAYVLARVREHLNEGASERLAFANAAASWSVMSNSFEAACAKVRRIWRGHLESETSGARLLSNDEGSDQK